MKKKTVLDIFFMFCSYWSLNDAEMMNIDAEMMNVGAEMINVGAKN